MHRLIVFGLAVLGSLLSLPAYSQHCPPLIESYLSRIELHRKSETLTFGLDYSKTGGVPMESYQAYLLAFRWSDEDEIAAVTPQEAMEKKLLQIVATKRIVQNSEGVYPSQWKLDTQDFVKQLLKWSVVDRSRTVDNGGWKRFQGDIGLAVFVPYLEDKKYAYLEGLPEDRHECNYEKRSALLFQKLPHLLSVHFGIVKARRLPENMYAIEINSAPPKSR